MIKIKSNPYKTIQERKIVNNSPTKWKALICFSLIYGSEALLIFPLIYKKIQHIILFSLNKFNWFNV